MGPIDPTIIAQGGTFGLILFLLLVIGAYHTHRVEAGEPGPRERAHLELLAASNAREEQRDKVIIDLTTEVRRLSALVRRRQRAE